MWRRILPICLSLALTVPPLARPAGGGTITVQITELRNTEGQVLISLYDKAEGFPKDRDAIISTKCVKPIESNEVEVVFEGLSPGEYALAVLHDENLSGDMDYGFLHLPKEGYCISNNVRPRIRAPKFEKAKFALEGDNVTQSLQMIY